MDEWPLVTVVVPLHNHAEFIGEAIASVADQTYPNIELVVIDDGSSDDGVATAQEALRQSGLEQTLLKVQPNLGAAATIDRGVMLGSGQYVAILNSDDCFHPKRLQTLLNSRDPTAEHCFLFTGVQFLSSSDGQAIGFDAMDERFDWYGRAMALARWAPTAGFGLLCGSLTVTSSNFFFDRSLFSKLRGFNNRLRLAHDWDFVLRAVYFTEPIFLHEQLLTYRLHTRNSFSALEAVHYEEGLAALERYAELHTAPSPNPLAPCPGNWPRFFDFFAGRVSPWFSPEPVGVHLGSLPPLQTTPSCTRGQDLTAIDDRAIDHLHEGFVRRSSGHRFDHTTTSAAATYWNSVRKAK